MRSTELPYNKSATNEIQYVTESEMYNLTGAEYLGFTTFNPRQIYIQKDLPKWVEKVIIEHELWHFENGDKGGFWKNEIPAWCAAFKKYPLLTILLPFRYLSISRIHIFIRRILKNS